MKYHAQDIFNSLTTEKKVQEQSHVYFLHPFSHPQRRLTNAAPESTTLCLSVSAQRKTCRSAPRMTRAFLVTVMMRKKGEVCSQCRDALEGEEEELEKEDGDEKDENEDKNEEDENGEKKDEEKEKEDVEKGDKDEDEKKEEEERRK